MKQMTSLILVLFISCLGLHAESIENENIVIEIDYGNVQPNQIKNVSRIENQTVLEALQRVAKVETHPVHQYVIVTSIDGVRGTRGEMAWYYTIDGKSPGEIAYTKQIDSDTRHIKWKYQKDVCSHKVDGKL